MDVFVCIHVPAGLPDQYISILITTISTHSLLHSSQHKDRPTGQWTVSTFISMEGLELQWVGGRWSQETASKSFLKLRPGSEDKNHVCGRRTTSVGGEPRLWEENHACGRRTASDVHEWTLSPHFLCRCFKPRPLSLLLLRHRHLFCFILFFVLSIKGLYNHSPMWVVVFLLF